MKEKNTQVIEIRRRGGNCGRKEDCGDDKINDRDDGASKIDGGDRQCISRVARLIV